MSEDSNNPKSSESKQSRSALGVILAIVCVLSGLYGGDQAAKILPIWMAVVLTVMVGIILVGSLAASLGNDLLDVVIGCVVVVIIITVIVPAGAKALKGHVSTGYRFERFAGMSQSGLVALNINFNHLVANATQY